jgi:MFS superfamily sulfate permease-like transporter
VAGQGGWHSEHNGLPAQELPGILVFRWEAPLFFANAGMFRDQVRELVRERRPRWVVLQCEAITDIDVTAAGVLEQLDLELNERGVNIAFVELRSRLKELVYDYGLFATLDADHFYDSIEEALADIRRTSGDSPNAGTAPPS